MDLATKVLSLLKLRVGEFGQHPITRRVDKYTHSLQAAQLAWDQTKDERTTVMALVHDVFGGFGSLDHGDSISWVMSSYLPQPMIGALHYHEKMLLGEWHGPAHSLVDWVKDRTSKEEFSMLLWFAARVDLKAFDPTMETESIDFFIPMVYNVFSRKDYP